MIPLSVTKTSIVMTVTQNNKEGKPKRQRSINQIRKYVWLIRELHENSKGLSYEELNDKWREISEDFDDGSDLSKKTLHNWITAIKEVFNIYIENENKSPYRYHIDMDDIGNDEVATWMMDTISLGSMLHGLRVRVLLTDKPTGHEQLETILTAME